MPKVNKRGDKAPATQTAAAPEADTKSAASWGDVQNGWSSFIAAFAPYQSQSSTGVQVSPLAVLQSSAVYACVRRLALDCAKLPLRMVRRLPNGGWEEETAHPVAKLLLRPNRRSTRFEFVQNIVFAQQLTGNAHVAIVRDSAGNPTELIPLTPGSVSVVESPNGGDLFYHVNSPMLTPSTQKLSAENVTHIRNVSLDGGINGASPVRIASEVMGLALATQKLAATQMRNGANFNGVLTSPNKLSPEQIRQTSSAWHESQAGVDNAGKTPVLQGGLKFERTGMSAEESQLLESRKQMVEEICRLFGMPPHKVGSLDGATFSNIEEQSRSYVDDTLMAITRPIEEALERDLLFADEIGRYKFAFDFNELLRGNRKDRVAAQAQAIQNGLLSVNEARAEDNRPPVPGGDVFRVQMNMAALTDVNQPINGDDPSEEEDAESESA